MSNKITQESVDEFEAQVVAVGTTRVQLVPAIITLAKKSVHIKAGIGNANNVFVGGPGVLAADGYPLDAGEEVVIKISDPTKIHMIADAISQTVSVLIQ